MPVTLSKIAITVGVADVNPAIIPSIYPNPVQNELHINLKQQSGHLTLYNKIGVICLEQPIVNQAAVNLSTLKPGLYFYTVTVNGQAVNGKLIKE